MVVRKVTGSKKPAKRPIDFSGVKDGGGISPKRVPEGDYPLKIASVTDEISKNDNDMLVYILEIVGKRGYSYPYHCVLDTDSLWKLYNLIVATGKEVPKKRVSFDPNSIVGAEIGGTLVDDEYEGRPKSTIASVFPLEDLDEEEEKPARQTSPKSPATKGRSTNRRAPVDDDVTDEEMDAMEVDDLEEL